MGWREALSRKKGPDGQGFERQIIAQFSWPGRLCSQSLSTRRSSKASDLRHAALSLGRGMLATTEALEGNSDLRLALPRESLVPGLSVPLGNLVEHKYGVYAASAWPTCCRE